MLRRSAGASTSHDNDPRSFHRSSLSEEHHGTGSTSCSERTLSKTYAGGLPD